MEVEVKTKKWGNSIGLIIPSEAVERLNIKPEQKMIIEVKKKENVLKELFGAGILKKGRTVDQIIKENRKGFESKWM